MRSDSQDPRVIGEMLNPPHIATRATWYRQGASRRMFFDGRLRRLGRGLWTTADVENLSSIELVTLLASVLPPDAVIGGWAAALVHQTRDCGPRMTRTTAFRTTSIVNGLVPIYLGRQSHKLPAGFSNLRVDLAADQIIERSGLRVTTPCRTAYDMARFAPTLSESVGVLDCFAFDRNPARIELEDVRQLASRYPKARGNPMVSRGLDLASTRSRSFPESTIRVSWIRDAGIAADQILINAILQLPNERPRELDFVDLTSGLVGEYDGLHHADLMTRSYDARKADLLERAGLGLIRYTANELRLSDAALAELTNGRRSLAIARGGQTAAQTWHTKGCLAERRLAAY